MDDKNENWERELLEKLASSSISEQRRARRWGIFFKLLTFRLSDHTAAAVDAGQVTGDLPW